jgi:hypothetical protein
MKHNRGDDKTLAEGGSHDKSPEEKEVTTATIAFKRLLNIGAKSVPREAACTCV